MKITLTEQILNEFRDLIKKQEHRKQVRRFLFRFVRNSGKQLERGISDEDLIKEARRIVRLLHGIDLQYKRVEKIAYLDVENRKVEVRCPKCKKYYDFYNIYFKQKKPPFLVNCQDDKLTLVINKVYFKRKLRKQSKC